MTKYRPPLFNFSTSSMASVFGIEVYGGKEWWRLKLIRPIYRVGNTVYEWIWGARYRLQKKHRYHLVDTGLKPGYYDVDYLMLNACFALLSRYVEKECGGDSDLEAWAEKLSTAPDKNAPEGWQEAQGEREMKAVDLYRWWKVKRPADLRRRKDLTHILYSKPLMTKPVPGTDLHELLPPDHGDKKHLRDELWALERVIEDEEQEMLHRLIDIRGGLWT